MLHITVGSHELLATFEDNPSAREFQTLLTQGPLTIEMEDYGGFEKVGPLGTTLSRSDQQITTEPGDVILYQGNQITIYYGSNTWSFTPVSYTHLRDTPRRPVLIHPGKQSIDFGFSLLCLFQFCGLLLSCGSLSLILSLIHI